MKIAIITGASNGIGKSAALELAKRGIGLILTYHSNSSGADDVVKAIQSQGGRAVALKLDVSKSSSFPDFALTVEKVLSDNWQRSSFDYLVNNAGTGGGMMFAETTEDYFDRIMDTNFKGPFFLTQSLLPLLADGSQILNISSGSSRLASIGFAAYGSSKAALSCLTRYLAKELAPRQIRVNTISPGPVQSNFADGAFEKHPEYIAPLSAQTVLGRIAQPEDIALAIAGLLSDDARWITAQDVEVSGGFML